MTYVSLRVQADVASFYAQSGNRSAAMRDVLTEYARKRING